MYNFECPVRPRQTVWELRYDFTDEHNWRYVINPRSVAHISIVDADGDYSWWLLGDGNYIICDKSTWMTRAFPTKEEAEAALKKLEDKK